MEENKPVHNLEDIKPPDNEQPLNHPSSDELIVSTEATTEAEPQPAPMLRGSNQQPATDMEVHHHAHHEHGPDSHHKKSWKTYFFDFFMLFLAVLCGFLAEYQLEHKIERDRAKQFLQSMLIDVRTNIVNLD